MTLPTRQLGTTGLDLTTVGLGAWAIGGGGYAFGWGPQDDDTSVATIRAAVDRGINWIDTAAVYGLGRSEEVVGRAIRDMGNDRPYVFTKCGMVWDHDDLSSPPAKVGSAASIRLECDSSLRRLGVERIDLLQLHWPPKDGTLPEEFWGTLVDLRSEGKIRAAGVSNFRIDPLRELERIGHVDALQPPLSLLNRNATNELLPWASSHGTGVLCYSPLQSGLLTGGWSQERVAGLPADDWRRRSPDFNANLSVSLGAAEAARSVAAAYATTPSAVVIAWVLAQPGVTGAIVGARRPEQIDDWIGATELSLSEADLDALTG